MLCRTFIHTMTGSYGDIEAERILYSIPCSLKLKYPSSVTMI